MLLRIGWLWCIWIVTAPALLAVQESPLMAKVRLAKDAYFADRDKAEDMLIALLDKRLEAAKKSGDLKTLEALQKEIDSFRAEGKLPKLVPTRDYESALKIARARYENALTSSIKSLTQAGNIDDAKAVSLQLEEFKAQTAANPDAALPNKAPLPAGKLDLGPFAKVYPEDKQAELAPGLALVEFPRHPTLQLKDTAINPLMLGTPLNLDVTATSGFRQNHNRNGLVVGYIKIDKAGEHLFRINIWGGSAAVYLYGKELIPYKKEGLIAKANLPAGYAPVAILTFVRKEGDGATLQWQPPGGTELGKIPEDVLSHRPPTADWQKLLPKP
jgi:hypothetical protein